MNTERMITKEGSKIPKGSLMKFDTAEDILEGVKDLGLQWSGIGVKTPTKTGWCVFRFGIR